jgi:hypothetical protein
VAVSQNYLTPQQKQKTSLLEVVKNQEEYDFVNAMATMPLNMMKELEPKTHESVIDLLGKWRWMSGVSSVNQDEDEIATELALISKFVMNNYDSLSLEEISLAIDLSLVDKLNCDVRTFNTFSPMYVSRILNAYIEYRRRMYNELSLLKERKEEEKELSRKPTPQERRDGMVEFIQYLYDKHKANEEFEDLFSTVFFFLKRTNRITLSKEDISEALEYGNHRANEYVLTHFDKALKSEKPDKENLKKRFARHYSLQKFFDRIDINALISSIETKEFE